MDTDSIIQLIAIVILLVLSAFFSSAETSFITVNRIKVLSLVEEGNKRAALVIKIIDQPAKMLSAVLIGNNIVNISCSALATSFTISVWGNKAIMKKQAPDSSNNIVMSVAACVAAGAFGGFFSP